MFQFLVRSFRADDGGDEAMMPRNLPLVEQPLREAAVETKHGVRQTYLFRILQVHGVDGLEGQCVDLCDDRRELRQIVQQARGIGGGGGTDDVAEP
jgi:hypothetical protein